MRRRPADCVRYASPLGAALAAAVAVGMAWGQDRGDRSQLQFLPPPAAEAPAAAPRVVVEPVAPASAEKSAAQPPVRPAWERMDRLDLRIGGPEDVLPHDYAAEWFAQFPTIPATWGAQRDWPLWNVNWEAPALCHGPLYFEDVNLERYGYSWGVAQPAVSAAKFATRVAGLPYQMADQPPFECVYTLGQGRPGTYFPHYLHRPPVSVRGGLAQAGVVTGLIFLIP